MSCRVTYEPACPKCDATAGTFYRAGSDHPDTDDIIGCSECVEAVCYHDMEREVAYA